MSKNAKWRLYFALWASIAGNIANLVANLYMKRAHDVAWIGYDRMIDEVHKERQISRDAQNLTRAMFANQLVSTHDDFAWSGAIENARPLDTWDQEHGGSKEGNIVTMVEAFRDKHYTKALLELEKLRRANKLPYGLRIIQPLKGVVDGGRTAEFR